VQTEFAFCPRCGRTLSTPCPACGFACQTHFAFCPKCGSDLSGVTDDGPESESPAAGEQRRWATVLFADVAGFTAMSERMDPEDVKEFADECARRLSEQVHEFGGTVLRVIGDETLAVFGLPATREDNAERAVREAIAMRDCLERGVTGSHPVQVHAGVNSGQTSECRDSRGGNGWHRNVPLESGSPAAWAR
jgi:adenylate cyclase